MLQVGGDANFAEESLVSQYLRQLGMNHLDGDMPIMLQVLGQPDGRHAAATELSLDPVVAGKRGLEPGKNVGHAMIRVVMDGLHYSGHRSPHTPSQGCQSGSLLDCSQLARLEVYRSIRSTSSFTALM